MKIFFTPSIGVRNVSTTCFFVLTLAYFSYHAISAEGGLLALVQLSKELSATRTELQVAHAKREQLEHRTQMLKSESLDLDLLDEQARKILGYAKPDEVVIMSKPSSSNVSSNYDE